MPSVPPADADHANATTDARVASPSTATAPAFEPRQEKRFAVVMYGGVSLAIYINGVAQELFRLVKSTAPSTDRGQLSGSAQVYRRLAEEIGARFVVDILSGTSAGGINAVFLAKALANDQPFDVLERVWVDEGDIASLINDGRSASGVRSSLARSSPRSPRSLLNGARLYEKVLGALGTMSRSGSAARRSLVDDLDLFVTTTDLQGLPAPIRLSDDVVYERRHRHVFRFQKRLSTGGDARNDFTEGNDEMLAFASRCTSSFPVAFEPVLLKEYSRQPEKWKAFFERYLTADDGTAPFAARAFADGGYLDNKPFTYAIETIGERHSDVPVDRKLLYIEPSPDELEVSEETLGPPNALENALKAFSLAQYETIREDVELIRSRNALLDRMERMLRGTEDDINRLFDRLAPQDQPLNARAWFDSDLDDMIDRQGIAYAGYLRLRVARLTDELADVIASQGGFAVDSDECLAIRYLVRCWRDERYAYYTPKGDAAEKAGGKESFTHFITEFDLTFHVRRLAFAIGKIDSLLMTDEKAAHTLDARGIASEIVGRPDCRDELLRLRAALSAARTTIRGLAAERRDGTRTGLSASVRGMGIDRSALLAILRPTSDGDRLALAAPIVAREATKLTAVYDGLRGPVPRAIAEMTAVKKEVGLTGGPLPRRAAVGSSPREIARWTVAFYMRMFPHYDLVTYPVLQTANLGEEVDSVEVFRVSPRSPSPLAGSRFGHFGGFLDRTWRKNDILWGRLDGARRIMASLLPGPEHEAQRESYVVQAQEAILKEILASPEAHLDLLGQVLLGPSPRDRDAARASGRASRSDLEQALVRATLGNVGADELRRRFERFRVDEHPEPALFVRSLSRSTRVIGKVLKHIGDSAGFGPGGMVGAWVGHVGAVATGLLDVLLPGSWWYLLGRRWLSLLMVFGALLLALNVAFKMEIVGQLGGALVGSSALLMLLGLSLGRAVRTRTLRPLAAVPIIALLFLLAVGIAYTPAAIEAATRSIRGVVGP